MAIIKNTSFSGNFGQNFSFTRTEEENAHIQETYVSTGKLTIDPPVKTFDENGNLVKSERKYTFVDKAALDEYNADPVIVAMKARFASELEQAGGTTEHSPPIREI